MIPDPSQSLNPVVLLQQLVTLFQRVADRIAPPKQQSTPIVYDGVSPKSLIGGIHHVKLTTPYNQFVVNLTAGTINCYRNNYDPQGNQVPDFVFNPTENPLPIPMGLLNDTQLVFVVAASSVSAAYGTIYVNRY